MRRVGSARLSFEDGPPGPTRKVATGDGEDSVETDFGMIEGKEQDGISEWCRKYSSSSLNKNLTAYSRERQA